VTTKFAGTHVGASAVVVVVVAACRVVVVCAGGRTVVGVVAVDLATVDVGDVGVDVEVSATPVVDVATPVGVDPTEATWVPWAWG